MIQNLITLILTVSLRTQVGFIVQKQIEIVAFVCEDQLKIIEFIRKKVENKVRRVHFTLYLGTLVLN